MEGKRGQTKKRAEGNRRAGRRRAPLRARGREGGRLQTPGKVTEKTDMTWVPMAVAERAIRTLFGAAVPSVVRDLHEEIRERLSRAPLNLNAYGYDPWGFNPEVTAKAAVVAALFYRYYFRVENFGIENVPAGRMLVIANHAGQIAIDAAMISLALLLEAEPPRLLRGMGEYWLPTIPFFNVLMARVGGVVGTRKNCVDLLEQGEAVIAFPEGVRGVNKLFSQRYQLQEFGLGFMRLALQTDTPILPVAVIGSEEQAPAIANLKPLARLLGMPAYPITPTWPHLGPLGLIPLPVKYRIYFGEPMHFSGNYNDDDETIEEKVGQVKACIASMISAGLRARRSVFF